MPGIGGTQSAIRSPGKSPEKALRDYFQETLASAAGGILAFVVNNDSLHHLGAGAAPLIVGSALILRYLSMQQYVKVTGVKPAAQQ